MTAEYTVKLPLFEGPLDLLLHLIKVNELEISEISITSITSQYLDYLRLMETLDLEVAGDFLVVAATLLNIKLRAILPEPEEEVEEGESEEGDNFVTARALMQRLIEYRKFKEAGQGLGSRHDRQGLIFMREVALPKFVEAEADPEVRGDLNLLLEAFSRVIKFVQRRDYHRVEQEEYTIEEKIVAVRRRLLIETQLSLNELMGECEAKIEMIVTLIAMLELCRLKELKVVQNDAYDDILITRRDDAPPEDESMGDELAREARDLEKLEAALLASRTGLVDDGSSIEEDEEDEDTLLEKLEELELVLPPMAPSAPGEPGESGEMSVEEARKPAKQREEDFEDDGTGDEDGARADESAGEDAAEDESAGEDAAAVDIGGDHGQDEEPQAPGGDPQDRNPQDEES